MVQKWSLDLTNPKLWTQTDRKIELNDQEQQPFAGKVHLCFRVVLAWEFQATLLRFILLIWYDLDMFSITNFGTIYIENRWLLRFEYQLPHPILYTTLATDKKWPFSQFHLLPKLGNQLTKSAEFPSQFCMFEIFPKLSKKIFHWRISF